MNLFELLFGKYHNFLYVGYAAADGSISGGSGGGNWYESIGNDSSLSRPNTAPPTHPAPPGLPPLRNSSVGSNLSLGSAEAAIASPSTVPTPPAPPAPPPPPPPPPPPSAPVAKSTPVPPTPPAAMTLPSVNSGGLSAALKNAQLRKVSKVNTILQMSPIQ